MARQKPTRTPTPGDVLGEYIETHPAYATIGASRVSSGGGYALFGSDFLHQHFMTVTIRRADLRRGLSSDWTFGSKEVIEVAMSEAQWATFVSSPNMGTGVPCTIQYEEAKGGHVPRIEPDLTRHDQFAAEVDERVTKAIARARAGLEKAKTKAERETFEGIIRDLTDGLPWVAKQFDAHMERTVEAAKIEVNAYATAAITRAGLAALGAPPLVMIESGEDDGA